MSSTKRAGEICDILHPESCLHTMNVFCSLRNPLAQRRHSDLIGLKRKDPISQDECAVASSYRSSTFRCLHTAGKRPAAPSCFALDQSSPAQ